MLTDYFKLAFKNLRHRGLRSWLTILGIVIGIAAVVALISLGTGLQTAILGQFGTLSVDRLTIQNKGTGFGPHGSTVVEKLTNHDMKVIESVQGVEYVIPRLIRVVKFEYNDVSSFMYVGDISETQEGVDGIYSSFSAKAEEGRLLQLGDEGKVLLGNDVANTERFGKELRVGKKVKIEGKEFEIIGILEKSSNFQMNSVIVMTTKDLKEILNIGDEWDMLVAKVEDKNDIEFDAEQIENKLRQDRKENLGEETFSVETPAQSLAAVNNVLNIVNAIVVGIAAISLLVGAIGIANTMYTSILERTKEIGTMKAIGATNRDILLVFLIESGLLGLVGGLIGTGIGLGGAIGISNIAKNAIGSDLFQVAVSYPLLLGAITFAFLIGILSGVLPALQASKLKPVEALRK